MPTDNEQILAKLTDFHSEFTEFRGEMKARIRHVEEDVDNARKWENIKIFMVLPITAAIHTFASKIGFFRG